MKNKKWILQVFVWSFVLSMMFSYTTNVISMHANIILTAILVFLVIAIGIIFDMIGAATLTSKESVFHAMNSQKIKGANIAIVLIKNNVKVSSICNDIVGDICGIISGGLGAMLAISIATTFNINISLITIIISALISSLTVGGKALCKTIAIKKADKIVFITAKIIHIFKKS